MGCISSTAIRDKQSSVHYYECYAPPLPPPPPHQKKLKTSLKRSSISRSSCNSSGIPSSQYSTPSRQSTRSQVSLQSGNVTYTVPTPKPKPKPNNLNYAMYMNTKDWPKASGSVSICDDFGESQQQSGNQPHSPKKLMPLSDGSIGYYSETASSGTNSPVKQESTTTYTSIPQSPTNCNLEMEVYMITHTDGLMQRTSSPILRRLDTTFDLWSRIDTRSPSSYRKWCSDLERNSTVTNSVRRLRNKVNIREAIAGHYCPKDFPAYTTIKGLPSVNPATKSHTVTSSMQPELQHVIYTTEL